MMKKIFQILFTGSLLFVSSVQDLAAGNDAFLRRVIYDMIPADGYVWNWRDAVVIRGLIEVYDTDPELRGEVLDYVREAMLATAPKAHGHHPNGVASGAGLAFLIRAGADQDGYFRSVAGRVFEQYLKIPRAENGACSHRPDVVELWDDTVYMLTVFLTEMYRATGDIMYIDICADEVLSHAEKLMDPETGLWYHGWAQTRDIHRDACCQDGWNDNPLQRNGEFWGRGNGWIAMSLVDLLAVMPETHEDYPAIMAMMKRMMSTLVRLQDRKTGHWYQLPLHAGDAGRGNFIESSCTAMFGYALSKAVKKGWLAGSRYRKCVGRAFSGLERFSVDMTGTGDCAMSNICAGTCIGDREYYYGRGISSDESFALGAMILFDRMTGTD